MSIVTSLWRWLAEMLRRHFAARTNVVVPPVAPAAAGKLDLSKAAQSGLLLLLEEM